jgi:hypothetical protein
MADYVRMSPSGFLNGIESRGLIAKREIFYGFRVNEQTKAVINTAKRSPNQKKPRA